MRQFDVYKNPFCAEALLDLSDLFGEHGLEWKPWVVWLEAPSPGWLISNSHPKSNSVFTLNFYFELAGSPQLSLQEAEAQKIVFTSAIDFRICYMSKSEFAKFIGVNSSNEDFLISLNATSSNKKEVLDRVNIFLRNGVIVEYARFRNQLLDCRVVSDKIVLNHKKKRWLPKAVYRRAFVPPLVVQK